MILKLSAAQEQERARALEEVSCALHELLITRGCQATTLKSKERAALDEAAAQKAVAAKLQAQISEHESKMSELHSQLQAAQASVDTWWQRSRQLGNELKDQSQAAEQLRAELAAREQSAIAREQTVSELRARVQELETLQLRALQSPLPPTTPAAASVSDNSASASGNASDTSVRKPSLFTPADVGKWPM